MATHDLADAPMAASMRKQRWSIYRCEHGCVHVALDRLTLTFTPDEFRVFQELIRRGSRDTGQVFDDHASDARPH